MEKTPHRASSPPWWIAASLAIWAASLLGTLALDDPRLRYPRFLLLAAAAIAPWLVILRSARHGWNRGFFGAVIAAGIALRLAALFTPPAFSEDVFRHVYEGRVIWSHGIAFPFVHPPREAADHGVAPLLLDESWRRINHPHIPTIYPPLTQLLVAAAAALGDLLGGRHLVAIKGLFVLADLATWALIALALTAVGRKKEESVAWGLCPLVILEIAREGHGDSLTTAGLALGVLGFVVGRPRLGYIGWSAAALAKLNGLVLLPAAIRSDRRGLAIAAAILPLLALPVILGGVDAARGLGTYAGSWRAGDGAFSILLSISETLLGGDWARLGELTITRHQLARGLTAAVFVCSSVVILRRPYPSDRIPERAAVLLLLLLLLAPTLHPWYALWLLPLLPHAGRWKAPVLALVSLAWLAHHPGWLELQRGEWVDLGWVRVLMHTPVWAIFAWVAARAEGK